MALNPATRQGDTSQEQADIADEGWTRWGPVQGTAIALHLLSGIAILVDNRSRVSAHRPTTAAVIVKTALTGAALFASASAYGAGAQLGAAKASADHDPVAAKRARALTSTMRALQWATPATTAGILVLDAYLGEQQRGHAGLLDRPTRVRDLFRTAG